MKDLILMTNPEGAFEALSDEEQPRVTGERPLWE